MSVGGRFAAVPVIPFRRRQEFAGVFRLRGVIAFAGDEGAREAAVYQFMYS